MQSQPYWVWGTILRNDLIRIRDVQEARHAGTSRDLGRRRINLNMPYTRAKEAGQDTDCLFDPIVTSLAMLIKADVLLQSFSPLSS